MILALFVPRVYKRNSVSSQIFPQGRYVITQGLEMISCKTQTYGECLSDSPWMQSQEYQTHVRILDHFFMIERGRFSKE